MARILILALFLIAPLAAEASNRNFNRGRQRQPQFGRQLQGRQFQGRQAHHGRVNQFGNRQFRHR